ncbi:MAG TPA: ABC transporter permease subunit, partial [Ilumatobacteraceae bacterium]|nr:ABC transporter permease subunit [Ilumatobacteraceae bacterium]
KELLFRSGSVRSVVGKANESGLLLFPPTGIPAVLHSLKARRLERQGEIEQARVSGERARDWAWYSVGVGLLVYVVAFLVYLLTVKNGAVRKVNFDWNFLWNRAIWSSVWRGFRLNLKVFAVASLLVMVWGLIVAVVRLLPGKQCAPIRFVATLYCDVFRAIPALLVIGIVGFGIPKANPPILGGRSDFFYATLSLVLVYGAYVSEVYRAGITSIHWSQTAAARSLGLSYRQTMT